MSTTLYAQPTKEWVIPPRPRPGRKPKKDESTAAEEDDEKAKKVQNRAAQRAFRERKQSQLAELQARIAAYEQGEIERNVALQTLAKRLKEENESLKAENEKLKSSLESMSKKLESLASSGDAQNSNERPAHRRNAVSTAGTKRASSTVEESHEERTEHIPSSSRKRLKTDRASSRSSNGSSAASSSSLVDSSYSLSHSTSTVGTSVATSHSKTLPSELNSVPTPVQQVIKLEPSSILDSLPPYAPPVPLRRRNVTQNQKFSVESEASKATSKWVLYPPSTPEHESELSDDTCTGDPANCAACADDPANQAFCAALGDAYGGADEVEVRSGYSSHHSAGDHADDERDSNSAGRSQAKVSSKSVRFAVDSQQLGASVSEERTSIGAQYSSAHESQVISNADESVWAGSDPVLDVSSSSLSLCCGDPKLCGGGCDVPSSSALVPLPSFSDLDLDAELHVPLSNSFSSKASTHASTSSLLPTSAATSQYQSPTEHHDGMLIPCNDAWKQLKQHPNIAFADLSLLADVVARRDHLDHHDASSDAEDKDVSMPETSPAAGIAVMHGLGRGASGAAGIEGRTLVPHDHLVQSGYGHRRRRVMQVQIEGVRDALTLLDGVRSLK